MANTYSQIHLQVICAVKRNRFNSERMERWVYKYITGIVQGQGHKLLAINGMPDHLHIFFLNEASTIPPGSDAGY